ncbi:hypothetical protein M1L60_03985 [Actinoplanes sp. TRM 88003]|uniref:Uncharacterized protein n=1 Tax=Paractinoplanes aksuensis TaxID=2939490 RepID=A0ABT1DFZ1_9ACTN|nr:hypothetical protein [Actinoplanes aksuensis]MCO8269750.1 hypothetical protein [Actinoplanes aksuensis]
MSLTITETRWAAHTSLVHLNADVARLRSDFVMGAGKEVLAADRAAVHDSRRVLNTHRASLVDVTV